MNNNFNYPTKSFSETESNNRSRSYTALGNIGLHQLVLDSLKENNAMSLLARSEDHFGIVDTTSRIRIELASSWSVECTIYIENKSRDIFQATKEVTTKDGEEIRVIGTDFRGEISWSGTGRNMANAGACVKLYAVAIDIVNTIISKLDRYEYVYNSEAEGEAIRSAR